MKILKMRYFEKWSSRYGVSDEALIKAAYEVSSGLVEAKLGARVFKKRLAGKTKGKRGSYRVVIAFQENDKLIYMYGYAKSEKANISRQELYAYRKLADDLSGLSDKEIKQLISTGYFSEVTSWGKSH